VNGRPIDPHELGSEGAELEGVTRELEAFADETRLAPSGDLTDRIMTAVAAEPAPTPPITFLHAVGALALMDAWRAWGLNLRTALGAGPATGRLRLQALAVVVVAALVVGLGGTTVAVGAARVVQAIILPRVTGPDTLPSPPEVSLSPDAPPSPSADASPGPDPSDPDDASAEPVESAEPEESGEPDQSDESDDGSGGSSGSSQAATPRPTGTPEPDEPNDDAKESGNDAHETQTPEPSDAPTPTPTSGSSGPGSGDSD
jgi:hypothetical protein